MPCMRHSLLLYVLAVERVFAQLAALADFNGTLQGSQGELILSKGLWEPLQWNDASSVARR